MISKAEQGKIEDVFRREAAMVAALSDSDIFRSAQTRLVNVASGVAGVLAGSRTTFDRDSFMQRCGFHFESVGGWLIERAEARQVRHVMSGEVITCRQCNNDTFYYLTRSTDYQNLKCASCGHTCQTLTETGACR